MAVHIRCEEWGTIVHICVLCLTTWPTRDLKYMYRLCTGNNTLFELLDVKTVVDQWKAVYFVNIRWLVNTRRRLCVFCCLFACTLCMNYSNMATNDCSNIATKEKHIVTVTGVCLVLRCCLYQKIPITFNYTIIEINVL